jgi:phytoene synthase
VPPGSSRYWSWLFASQDAREPLLGMYALMAEWRVLMDPRTETAVAHIKLAWWREEMQRLADRKPAHPITRYVAAMPLAEAANLASLEQSVLAAAAQVTGAPLERATELAAHSFSLYGIPLRIAGQLGGLDDGSGETCLAHLASAEYVVRTVADYRSECRAGRVPFPVDELLAAGIEDADLSADEPPPPLQHYLVQLRTRAAGHFADAKVAMDSAAPAARARQRHLSILAELGIKHLNQRRSPASADFRLSDLYNAWSAARHAARGR